jgi:hypothetical protein
MQIPSFADLSTRAMKIHGNGAVFLSVESNLIFLPPLRPSIAFSISNLCLYPLVYGAICVPFSS